MFGILLKKQLYEVFRSYFYDAKKNRARSKASIVGWFIFFAVIMIVVLGGMFTGLSWVLCGPLAELELGWLYFVLMGLLAVLLGIFGSVFNTYAGLYCSKDNDLLLSMPIPIRSILAARLANVYLMGLMYSAVVILPAVLVYLVEAGPSLRNVTGGLVLLLEISAVDLILSCLLGWVVAQISMRLKHKNILTVVASLVFICAYYFFYFKASDYLQDLLANAAYYGGVVKNAAYPLFVWGRTGEGDPAAMLISLAVTGVLVVLTWRLMSRSFLKLATATGASEKRVYREKTAKQLSPDMALLGKELSRFTGSANYMLNCGLGILLMPVTGIVLLVKGSFVREVAGALLGEDLTLLTIVIIAAIGMLASMNAIAAPSVSLEGRNLWLAQSLPVRPWQVLRAKLRLHLLLTELPAVVCLLCALPILPGTWAERAAAVITVLTTILLQALWGLYLAVKLPILNWTNETAPIKQSMSVLMALLGSALFSVAYAGLYIWQGWKIGVLSYELAGLSLILALCFLLWQYLRTKGAAEFAAL